MKIKKIVFLIATILVLSTQSIFAAELHLSTEKTNLSTDDIATISLSVDGQIDNSQVSLSGLDNFNIVGRSSSQKVSITNGQTTVLQEQIFSLQPLKDGKFTIQAIAKENGEEIKSDKIIFNITKSLLQSTRDKLLGKDDSIINNNLKKIQNTIDNDKKKKDQIKDLLTSPQNNNKEQNKTNNILNKKESSFPEVKQISAFNSWFWLELFGIIFLLLTSIFMIFSIKKKLKKN